MVWTKSFIFNNWCNNRCGSHGDLNFRIIPSEQNDTTFKEYNDVFNIDQLNIFLQSCNNDLSSKAYKYIANFKEGIDNKIIFNRTCKFKIDDETKKRVVDEKGNQMYDETIPPSWCDRILYHTTESSKFIPFVYNSYDNPKTMSFTDHSIVYMIARFNESLKGGHNDNYNKDIRDNVDYYKKYLKYKSKYLNIKSN